MNDNTSKPTIPQLQHSLLSLYNSLKTRLTHSKSQNNTQTSNHSDSSPALNNNNSNNTQDNINPFLLINYIKETIDTLIQNAINEQVDEYYNQQENAQQEYESILVKYESDIRGHIRVEHQLKLYADNLSDEIEQLTREKKNLLATISKYKKNHNLTAQNLENEIKKLKKEINELKEEREKIKSLYKTNTISKEEKEDLKRMKVKRIR